MLSPLKDYFHYSSSERKGFVALIIVLILVLLWYFVPHYSRVNSSSIDNEEFRLAEEKFEQNKKSKKSNKEYFLFNPNTIGVEKWCLLGFSEKQAASIEKYKASGAVFYKKSDLLKLFMVDSVRYMELYEYIDLPLEIQNNYESYVPQNQKQKEGKEEESWMILLETSSTPIYEGFEEYEKVYYSKYNSKYFYAIGIFDSEFAANEYSLSLDINKNVDFIKVSKGQYFYPIKNKVENVLNKKYKIVKVNSADTSGFIQLKGIGSYYASRIIKYRELLGGFSSIEQIKDVYNLPPETIDDNAEFLSIDFENIKKININEASVAELKKHPYINWNIANSIVQIKNNYGNFEAVSDIQKSHLIDNELYLKLQPYLKVK